MCDDLVDLDPSFVTVDDEVPVVVVGNVQANGAFLPDPAVIDAVAIVEVVLEVGRVHEANEGLNAADLHFHGDTGRA